MPVQPMDGVEAPQRSGGVWDKAALGSGTLAERLGASGRWSWVGGALAALLVLYTVIYPILLHREINGLKDQITVLQGAKLEQRLTSLQGEMQEVERCVFEPPPSSASASGSSGARRLRAGGYFCSSQLPDLGSELRMIRHKEEINAELEKTDKADPRWFVLQKLLVVVSGQPWLSFRFGGPALGDAGARALAGELTSRKSWDEVQGLQDIDLADNEIGPEGVTAVAAALPRSLRRLNLKGNAIADEGLKAVMQALPGSLTSLGLQGTAITAEGLQELHVLPPRLRDLHLGGNALLGFEALAALFDRLFEVEAGKNLQNLQYLYLSGNALDGNGAVELLKKFTRQNTPNLVYVFLYDNKIDIDASYEALREVCKRNRIECCVEDERTPIKTY